MRPLGSAKSKLGKRHGQPKLPKFGQKKGGKPNSKKGKGKKRPPIDPTAPLNAKQFRREVRKTTNQQIRPLANQIRSERAGSLVRQNQEIPAWFQDYQNQVSGAQAATSQAYGQAGAQWGEYLKQADTQDTAARKTVNDAAQADAAKRGANVSTVAADQAANASARRTDIGAVGGGTIARQGANQFAYLEDKKRIGGREKIEQQLQEGKRRGKIDTDLRELMREKGELRTKVRADLRASERDYRIQNKAFGPSGYNAALNKQSKASVKSAKLNQAGVKAQAAAGLAGDQVTAAATNTQTAGGIKKQKLKNKGYKNLPSGGGGGKDVSGSQDISYASGKLRSDIAKGGYSRGEIAKNKNKVIDGLVNKYSISRGTAAKAVNKYLGKGKKKGSGLGGRNPGATGSL